MIESLTTGQVSAAQRAVDAMAGRRFDDAMDIMAAAGIDTDVVEHLVNIGVIEDRPLVPEQAAETYQPYEPPVRAQPGAPRTSAAPSVALPDGTDTTDPRVQSKVTTMVRQRYGEHAVVMWPRYRDVEDGVAPVIPIVLARGADPKSRELGADVKPTDGHKLRVFGERNGLDLVEFDPFRRIAVFAKLDVDARTIRDRLAALLKVDPWTFEVAVHRKIDDKTGHERLDQVVILRSPSLGTSLGKRLATWQDLVFTLPGGSGGWEILDDPVTGMVRLRYGQPRVLPGLVAMSDLLPDALDTSDWARIPVGVTPEGRPAALDLTAGPHALIVGPTGSGKSVFLRQHAASALAHGHDLIVIDAVKDGLDFLSFRPFCLAFADEGVSSARRIIEAVYAEGVRRKAVLKRFEAPSWIDLPPDIRRREGVRPLTVLFDEFMSAVIASPVPKGLDKDDPLVEEANRLNADKATILAIVGKISRELRFSGVFLAIAMQRPDASLLAGFGEIRSNLTSAIQLVKPGSLPAQETLRMVFPGDQTQAAAETIIELDDGSSKGLATIASDGGDVAGFRVGFGKPSEIPDLLRALGVRETTPWVLDDDARPPTPGEIIPKTQQPGSLSIPGLGEIDLSSEAPVERSLGEIEFSLDELEDDDPMVSNLDDFDPFAEHDQPAAPPPVADDDPFA